MPRRPLPCRRLCLTIAVVWQGHEFSISAGLWPDSLQIGEVFYSDGQKSGSSLQHSVQDACVLISIALQHGATLAELERSAGRIPVLAHVEPASPIGAILDALIRLDRGLRSGDGPALPPRPDGEPDGLGLAREVDA